MAFTRTAVTVLLALCQVCSLGAEEPKPAADRVVEQPKHRALWRASLLTLVAASTVDAHSSWGKFEANPVLANGGGRFGARGIALKGIITGGALGVQWIVLRRTHSRAGITAAATANFAVAGLYSQVAVRNYGIRR